MTSTRTASILALGIFLGFGALAACGGGGDDSTPASGSSAGSAGSTSGGSGGSTSGGAGGSTSGGKGGTTSGGSGGTTSGGSGGTTSGGSAGTTSGGSAGTSGGSAGSTSGGSAGSTSGGSAGSSAGGCNNPTVDVVYDLTGSTFEITDTPLGAGNQVNTLQMPYTDPKNIGPGSIKLRFTAPQGQPDAGRVDVIDFDLVLEFTVSTAGASVHTDLVVDVTPPVCSGAQGAFASGTATWMAPGLDPYHSKGNVTCTGGTCSLGGLPNGTPQPRDTTEKLKLNNFVFTNGVNEFTMEKVQVSADSKSKTWLALKAKAVGAPTASCACQ